MRASVSVVHACGCPTFWLAFWCLFLFVLVCLLPASFLVSQRSPRLFSHDQVPMNVEQRACQLAALLESRRALRHQVTTALPIWCPAAVGFWVQVKSGVRERKKSPKDDDHCSTVVWLKQLSRLFCVVSLIDLPVLSCLFVWWVTLSVPQNKI